MTPAPASIFAVELLGGLVRRGVTDVVVCPGSRSQALALAAAAAERAGAIRLHVRLDERSAGFFALGIARETGIPAPVIVTSGTAVADLAPAVFEAHEARVPMLVLAADRPAELRGIRSNQTTSQASMFAGVSRLSVDVTAPGDGPTYAEMMGAWPSLARSAAPFPLAADGILNIADVQPDALAATALSVATGLRGLLPAGPVHLNLSFREPLSGTGGFERMIAEGFAQARAEADATGERAAAHGIASPHRAQFAAGVFTDSDGAKADDFVLPAEGQGSASELPTIVIAGADAGPEAAAFAERAGLPLVAEIVSGARGDGAITHYRELLENPEFGGRVRRATVFGHPTLSRQVPALLKRDDVEVIVVDPHAYTDHFDPSRGARVVREARAEADTAQPEVAAELARWRAADDALSATAEQAEAAANAENVDRVTRHALALAVWRAERSDDRLMLAASRLVRVIDGVAAGTGARVHANRGLAGIDGTVATALGIAAAADTGDQTRPEHSPVTRVLIGDLALLHDAGSLLLPEPERAQRVQLIVGNDGGGTIFDALEVRESADPEAFERVMLTPQLVDLAALAAAYGWSHRRIDTVADLERALVDPELTAGPALIEVPLDR